MFDLAQAKEEMLKEHLQARGIEDERVLSAFREVPREEFIPQELNHLAYEDTPLEYLQYRFYLILFLLYPH